MGNPQRFVKQNFTLVQVLKWLYTDDNQITA